MAQSGLQLINTLVGTGTLMIDGHGTPVKYVVRIYQEMLETGIPGLKTASGNFTDLKMTDAVKAVGRSAQLTLQDGQKSDVILTDSNGTFVVSGPIS